ncbi:MAG: hypothetical protein ACXADB_03475 [Candidatus Hermodarchaeia archaeon]|jgi:hypothetical protein
MPLACVENIKKIIQKYNLSKNSIYRGGAFNQVLTGRRPTRLLLSKIVQSLQKLVPKDDSNLIELQSQISANYFLDEIKSIEKINPDFDYVYDITVNQHRNFALNGAAFVSNCYDIGEVLISKTPITFGKRKRMNGCFVNTFTLLKLGFNISRKLLFETRLLMRSVMVLTLP